MSDETQARKLSSAIAGLVRRFALSERADVSCCGMTVAQAATLGVLRDRGSTRLGPLGSRLGIHASTLTRNLRRLEERGHVRRRSDPGDARATLLELTPAGRRAAERIKRQELSFALSILDRLPARHRNNVLDSLGALMHAVRDATEACCGKAFDHLMDEFPDRRIAPALSSDCDPAGAP